MIKSGIDDAMFNALLRGDGLPYDEGVKAWMEGNTMDSCPYTDYQSRRAWRSGFDDAADLEFTVNSAVDSEGNNLIVQR